ncbi:MAG: HNH endonuclease [Betaproteobacteria bacterium]|nr:HNH endonuclease [Betaproteobacteria bacterium]
MAFSREVRTEALVAAARHCCLCHRYRGVKVEVHHIVPVAKGGADTADNAIALCFDCHADAGHYNPAHPRGTKISVDELRLARDLWHRAVQMNRIEAPHDEDWLYCRYLVCKSFSALREIVEGSLTQIPVDLPLLAKTVTGDFLSSILRRHPAAHPSSHVWGDAFQDRAEYERAHPAVRVFERSSFNLFPYFEASRIPSREELLSRLASNDSPTALLLEAGAPEAEISEAFAYDELCGRRCFQEIYRLRPLWGVFVAATNLTERAIRFEALRCEVEQPAGIGFRPFRAREPGRVENLTLPRMPVPPTGTVIIPIAVVFGPIGGEPWKVYGTVSQDVQTGEVQSTAHADGIDLINQLSLVGPSLWPISFLLDRAGTGRAQEIHQLDFSNLYTIDRSWESGSCPHLFLEHSLDSSLRYWGELWAGAPDESQVDTLQVPHAVKALLLTELESEVAYVVEVRVNGVAITRNRVLHRGETLRISVRPGDRVRLTGYYVPHASARNRGPDPWWKNELVAAFMQSATSNTACRRSAMALRFAP